MNRREFTKKLVAASVTPALPIPSIAGAAQATTMAKDPMYIWANFVSRVHNKTSPGMISRLLKVDPDQGAKLYAQLIDDGALTAPDAFGLSQSTNPLYPEFSKVMSHGKKALDGAGKVSKNKHLKTQKLDQDDLLSTENQECSEHNESSTDVETMTEEDPTTSLDAPEELRDFTSS